MRDRDRRRSPWGWGRVDAFPDADERRELATMAESLLGVDDLQPREPVPLAEASVPEPDLDLPDALAGIASQGRHDRALHARGLSTPDIIRGFRGDYASAPDLVAYPTTEDEVADVVDWARRAGAAVVPFGGGTSVVGGVDGDVNGDWAATVTLDTREMDQVLEVDRTSRAARIQAGATGPRISEQIEEQAPDLQLRHYPQSWEFSTLGGWVATRAGGHYATVYTHIDDLVESARLVTPQGEAETRRVPASGAGPDPNALVCGSEGVLGVITEAWVRLQDRPTHRSRASVAFEDWDEAVEAVRAIARSRLHPANCRLLGPTEALVNQVLVDGRSVLLLGFESGRHDTAPLMDQALETAREAGGEVVDGPSHGDDASGPDDAEGAWRDSFLEGPYLRDALLSVGVLVDTFETAVTWERLPDLHEAVQAEVGDAMEEACGGGTLSCRFTHVYPDGPAPYYTFMAPMDEDRALDQWDHVKTRASDVLDEHGATITHHHAVGRVHEPWYRREVPDGIRAALWAAKRRLDPDGVLNPGVLLDPDDPATDPP
jgi:alkyldihydroxyacetonephosphate synthase